MQGGCACGQVRHELRSEPFDTGYYHCTICRRVSGAPALVFSTVPIGDFVVTAGVEHVRKLVSSSFGKRQIHVAHQSDTIDFTVVTLDEPERVVPGFHIFHGSRIAWFETADELPRHQALRPSPRGL